MVHNSTIRSKSVVVVAAELERMIEKGESLQLFSGMQTDNAFGAVVTNLLAEYGIRPLKGRPAEPWRSGTIHERDLHILDSNSRYWAF